MKLHLPKMLLTAVLAACCVVYGAEQWSTPAFGGSEFSWTGGAGTLNYSDAENWSNGTAPARANNLGPVLVYDGVNVSVSGGTGIDTSDKGGIKAINGSIVTSTLGRWGGSIYVEKGSELTASLNTSEGTQLKNTESENVANVYVGGKLAITNSTLNLNDGNAWQNWQIDTYGSVDITAASIVNLKEGGSWNLQYLKSEIVRSDIDDYSVIQNRTSTLVDVTFNQQIVSSSFNLSNKFTSVAVIDKTTGERAVDDTYSLVYGESGGLSISYDAKTYASTELETSGDITWSHCGTGWNLVGGDETDTTFLNGDTVMIVGDGSANLLGKISVANIQVSEGVDYTVNMTKDSSLSVDASLNNFGGLKITGDASTSLRLNMDTNAEGGGDSRILLAEGSSIGSVYVDGVFAYNKQYAAVDSNVGGADLHMADGGTLLLRNGLEANGGNISGDVDANIGDIYFDGTSGYLRVYGSVKDATIADNICAKSATLYKQDGGTVTLGGTVQANSIMASGGWLNISGTTTIDRLRLSERGSGNVSISAGGELKITGSTNEHGVNCSILLAHWSYDSTLKVDGGTLSAADAEVHMSWDGRGTFEVLSGEATVKGLNFWGNGSWSALAGVFKLGTNDGDGTARINIGSSGLSELSYKQNGAVTITLSNGIVGATADWSTSYNANFTAATLNLTGTGTGTVFDTTDAIDGKTARTITLNNSLTGNGNLVKRGDGTLVLNKANSYTGTTTIEKGTIRLATADASLGSGVVNLDGGTLEVTKTMSISNNIDMAGSFATGTTNTVKNGELVIKDGATLTHTGTLWVGNQNSVKIASGSSLSKGNVTIKGAGEGATIIRQNEGGSNPNNTYTIGSSIHTISSAEVEVNSTAAVTVANSLQASVIKNNGSGIVTLTNGYNNLKAIEAAAGDINLQWVDSRFQKAFESISISAGHTVGARTNAGEIASTESLATLIVSKQATFGASATLNANLTLLTGASVTLDGALKMGDSTLTLGQSLTLDSSSLQKIYSLEGDGRLDLFTNVSNLVLGDMTYTKGTDILDANSNIDFENWFALTNPEVVEALSASAATTTNLGGGYYLGYDANGTVFVGMMVPEPTTATLSLMALAALAARRRRK